MTANMTKTKCELGPQYSKKEHGPKIKKPTKKQTPAQKEHAAKRLAKEKELVDKKAHTIKRERGNAQEHPAVLSEPASYRWSEGPHGMSAALSKN
jgi:hypothetical protein